MIIKNKEMRKPVKEWLEELDEPYRSQAIANFENAYPEQELKKLFDNSLVDALSGAFAWGESPEGFRYWSDLIKQLRIKINEGI